MFGLPFHHIGIACVDIESTANYVKQTFQVTSDTGTVFDPIQNAHVRLFNEGTNGAIELVAGPAVSSVLKNKATYYHVCYTTPAIEETLLRARKNKALLVSKPAPAVLFGMRHVAFVFTPLGLVEFLEER